ncbi:MAG: hypothetical protein ACPGUC_05855 [Gammaproteobacteria bacterium]
MHLTALVAGRGPGHGAPDDKQPWTEGYAALAATLSQLRDATQAFTDKHRRTCSLRILSGDAPGAETEASAIARELKLPLHRLLTSAPPVDTLDDQGPDARVVSLGFGPVEPRQDVMREKVQAIRDEIALAYVDMLIVVWDGKDCPAAHGGTVRLIHEAARQRKPVIWIDRDGQVRILSLADLSDALRHALGAYEADPALLGRCFEPAPTVLDETYLGLIESVLTPWTKADHGANEKRQHGAQDETQRLKCLVDREREAEAAGGREDWGWWASKAETLHRLVLAMVCTDSKALKNAWRSDSRLPYRGPVDPAQAGIELPVHEPSTLLNGFDAADVAANIYGGRHRGATWWLFGLAAVAVLLAVTGALSWDCPWVHSAAPIAELVVLLVLLGVYLGARTMDWHRDWVRRRFLAEQLRFAAMGFPLLGITEPLRKPLWVIKRGRLTLESAELWQLQRHVIEQGLPRALDGSGFYIPADHLKTAAKYVRKVIVDQRRYHRRAHRTNHRVHHRLHLLTLALFALTLIGVLLHFSPFHPPWLLYLTAFLPALAASIHGALNMLEVARMAKQSLVTDAALAPLSKAIKNLMDDREQRRIEPWLAWVRLRGLTTEAAAIMSDENELWAGILHNNQPVLG